MFFAAADIATRAARPADVVLVPHFPPRLVIRQLFFSVQIRLYPLRDLLIASHPMLASIALHHRLNDRYNFLSS
jgi:hypothetical protein